MFWNYFQVKKIDLPYDKTKEQRRAFCFVEFKEEDAVKKITDQAVHKIKDQEVRIHVCLQILAPEGYSITICLSDFSIR